MKKYKEENDKIIIRKISKDEIFLQNDNDNSNYLTIDLETAKIALIKFESVKNNLNNFIMDCGDCSISFMIKENYINIDYKNYREKKFYIHISGNMYHFNGAKCIVLKLSNFEIFIEKLKEAINEKDIIEKNFPKIAEDLKFIEKMLKIEKEKDNFFDKVKKILTNKED